MEVECSSVNSETWNQFHRKTNMIHYMNLYIYIISISETNYYVITVGGKNLSFLGLK